MRTNKRLTTTPTSKNSQFNNKGIMPNILNYLKRQCNLLALVKNNQSKFASRLTEASPGSSCHRTCKPRMPHLEEFSESLVQSEGATDPSPSCNELLSELRRLVVRATLPVLETADGHGQPPSHWQTPRVMRSLTVAVSGRLTK